MARPGRQGVDYFPLDVHLDNKIKFLVIKFGLEGLGAIVTIYQEIYANGYWYKWGEDEKLIFTHENNIEIETLDQVVNEALDRNIFNKDLFNKHSILTSEGVQKRYQKIVERRKDVEVIDKYLLIDGNFGSNEHILIDKCTQGVDIVNTLSKYNDSKYRQSKVKESKVKESTLKNSRKSIDLNFEELWKIYPSKKGKGRISNSKKKEIYHLGEEFERAIRRYTEEVERERLNGFKELKYQNGSTFFNSGYVDYLDENFKELKKDGEYKGHNGEDEYEGLGWSAEDMQGM